MLKLTPMTSPANADGVLLHRHVTVFSRHTVRFHSAQTRARRGTLLLHIGIRRNDLLRRGVLAS